MEAEVGTETKAVTTCDRRGGGKQRNETVGQNSRDTWEHESHVNVENVRDEIDELRSGHDNVFHVA